nr:MAG TPA: hypothetical protein [Caudoviricetes sp.]
MSSVLLKIFEVVFYLSIAITSISYKYIIALVNQLVKSFLKNFLVD